MTIALATLVAVSIKVVGALLITAILIVPAVAARPFSNTPERMVAGAALIGLYRYSRASPPFDTGTRRPVPRS